MTAAAGRCRFVYEDGKPCGYERRLHTFGLIDRHAFVASEDAGKGEILHDELPVCNRGMKGCFVDHTGPTDHYPVPPPRPTAPREQGAEAKDIHTEHCCKRHGCKYGDADCPVESGAKKQSRSRCQSGYDYGERCCPDRAETATTEEIVLHRVTGGIGFIPGIDDKWSECPGLDYHHTCYDSTFEHRVATLKRREADNA